MVIVHLSDLHLCRKNRPQNLDFTRRLLEYGLENGGEHFVITGDVTHDGNPDDFLDLRNLLQEYDLLRSDKLSMVIGNHDIFGGVYLASDIATFPDRCKTTNYSEKVKTFRDYFFEAFEGTLYPPLNEGMVYAKCLSGVLFVSFNSNDRYSLFRNPFSAAGNVTKDQLKELKRIFESDFYTDCVKIVLTHHHFNEPYKKYSTVKKKMFKFIEEQGNHLRHRKQLITLLRKNKVDLVLHGHVHESAAYSKKGLHFLNAGGSIDKNRPGELKMNIVTVKDRVVQTEIRIIPAKGVIHTKDVYSRPVLRPEAGILA
ncbi:MAG: metallophosphoesterase [Calditrichaeota bacterium]|nr:metallophosphoesterase [Calditrichota bacterium]